MYTWKIEPLLFSEILLILFIFFLWLLSIISFIRRYKLVLCFNNRNVPFIKSESAFKKDSNMESHNTSLPLNSFVGNLNFCDCESFNRYSVSCNDESSINERAENSLLLDMCSKCKKKKLTKNTSVSNKVVCASLNDKFMPQLSVDKSLLATSDSSFRFNKRYLTRNQTLSNDDNVGYYYSNGIVYSSSLRTPSLLLKKVNNMKSGKSKTPSVNLTENATLTALSENKNLNKISQLKKDHLNLKSLDENALNLYRKNHIKLNNAQQEKKSVNVQSAQYPALMNQKVKQLHLSSPHAHFISLRSDSITKNWLKPNLQKENVDKSSNSLLNSQQIFEQAASLRSLSQKNKLNSSCSAAEREINPKSSIRRHMFINSRRNALITSKITSQSLLTDLSSEHFASADNANNIDSNILTNIETFNGQHNISFLVNQDNCETIKECDNPNLLNPDWIPTSVKQTLLDIHEKVSLSNSDTSIKFKNSRANSLRSTCKHVNSPIVKMRTFSMKKKTLSLNEQKSFNYYVNNNNRNELKSHLISCFRDEPSQALIRVKPLQSFEQEAAYSSLETTTSSCDPCSKN